ncbi:MAG TPA: DUF1772 domain-containing protein [Candidatus Acidoferrales bacterium]|jgi:hypothetical protein|nr:DUF1772 domain-containing protein [Candidatus Acidoferrales bacterium]
METILKFLAVFSSGIFTGAAFYLTTVEHPARMSLGVEAALEEFRPSYKRAAPQQAALAIVCFLSSAALAAFTHDWLWLLGGSLVVAVVPFTFLFMMPTNRLLLNDTEELEIELERARLAKWARLHAVRTILSVSGFLVLLWECVAPR